MPWLKKSGLKPWAQRPKPPENRWTDEEAQRFYNSPAWRNCRKAYMHAHPLCEISLGKGRHVAGKECDHIIPVRFGGAQFHEGNLMSMSIYYHRRKSAFERNGNRILVGFVETEWGLIPKNKDEIIQVLRN